MKKRKLFIGALAMIYLSLTVNIGYCAYYPTEVHHYERNHKRVIEQIYELNHDQEPSAETKQEFAQDGYFYTLESITKNTDFTVDKKSHKEIVTVESQSKNIGDIMPLLAKTKAVTTADGYNGTLNLDESSITVEAKGYKTSSKTIQASRTYPNLLNADLAYIPKSITENGTELELADVNWQKDLTYNSDDYAIGERYFAEVLYQGTKKCSYVTGYVVTAEYEGEVTKETAQKDIYTLTFVGEREHELLLQILAGIGGMMLAGGVIYGIYRRKCRFTTDENINDDTEEIDTEEINTEEINTEEINTEEIKEGE